METAALVGRRAHIARKSLRLYHSPAFLPDSQVLVFNSTRRSSYL